MIPAQELRIGNIVQDEHGRIGVVQEFGLTRIKVKMEHSTFKSVNNKGVVGLQVDGVPISWEALVKFGFEEKTHINEDQDENDYLIKGEIYFDGKSVRYSFSQFRHIRFIHQLQNLYFALTGKELEYTP